MVATEEDPVVNINVLVDSKREYVDQLEGALVQPIFECVRNILHDAFNVCNVKPEYDELQCFSQLMSEIPSWNGDIISEETEQVIKHVPYLKDLLKAYFVCTSMILGSIRISKDKNQKMKVKVPSPQKFVHLVLKLLSSAIVDEVGHFVSRKDHHSMRQSAADDGQPEGHLVGEYKLNRRHTHKGICESVKSALHHLMPIDDILKEYMEDILGKDTFSADHARPTDLKEGGAQETKSVKISAKPVTAAAPPPPPAPSTAGADEEAEEVTVEEEEDNF
eukprot:jgi/Mesvir1/20196/Mv13434-RA.1